MNSPILYSNLKAKSGFSNKKWDKTLKGLTKHNLTKVNRTEEGLFVLDRRELFIFKKS